MLDFEKRKMWQDKGHAVNANVGENGLLPNIGVIVWNAFPATFPNQ